jgi:hypothetical protein
MDSFDHPRAVIFVTIPLLISIVSCDKVKSASRLPAIRARISALIISPRKVERLGPIWFALWHYGPGSISPLTNVWLLTGGAAVLGAGLSWLTRQTKSICCAAISHTLAGLAQVLS